MLEIKKSPKKVKELIKLRVNAKITDPEKIRKECLFILRYASR